MSDPCLTQSFLNLDELEQRSRLFPSSQSKPRPHNPSKLARRKRKDRRRRYSESVQGTVDPDYATDSTDFTRSGSASSATEPRSPLESTPKKQDSEPRTPTGIIPCTPLSFAVRPGDGESRDRKHQGAKSSVTIVLNITTPGAPTADAPTARPHSKLEITIHQGPTNEVKLEGWGWDVTSTNVVRECQC